MAAAAVDRGGSQRRRLQLPAVKEARGGIGSSRQQQRPAVTAGAAVSGSKRQRRK